MPLTSRSSVDLPAPEGPVKATNCPCGTSSETSSSTVVPWKLLPTSDSRSTGSPITAGSSATGCADLGLGDLADARDRLVGGVVGLDERPGGGGAEGAGRGVGVLAPVLR